MKAIGFADNSSSQLFEKTTPVASGHDLLIKIDAIAVNPVDTKVVSGLTAPLTEPKIVGWDVAGTIIAIGDDVALFNVGDSVFYAGDITRDGCYASHQLVDEHIVGKAPKTLSSAHSAAMPLTTITAWESLFSRLRIDAKQDAGKHILIIGGAGGVGSIAIQLAKVVGSLNVITTASRPESIAWCKELGADHIINHHGDLIAQYRDLGISDPDYILCLNDTDYHFQSMAELIAPQGLICSIVGTQEKHDLDCLKSKSAGFVWEFMFTRPMLKTADRIKQHHLLNTVSSLIDEGKIKSTLSATLGKISVENIHKAHQQLQQGNTIGKLALMAIE